MARNISPRRIASLLPAATEIVWALGAGDRLVGVSHACDFPPETAALPRLTVTAIDPGRPSGEIDAAVRERHAAGLPVIAVDGSAVTALRPDLILAQDLCEVCAVMDGSVCRIAEALVPAPEVFGLRGRTLTGVLEDIRAVASRLHLPEAGERVVGRLAQRMSQGGAPTAARRRVVVIEWLEPLYLAGHWVPEMVACAGGIDVGAEPGSHSVPTTWERVTALRPDVVIVALCGFGLERARAEWRLALAGNRAAAACIGGLGARVVTIDGNAYTSRPGPRLVEGIEVLAAAIES